MRALLCRLGIHDYKNLNLLNVFDAHGGLVTHYVYLVKCVHCGKTTTQIRSEM